MTKVNKHCSCYEYCYGDAPRSSWLEAIASQWHKMLFYQPFSPFPSQNSILCHWDAVMPTMGPSINFCDTLLFDVGYSSWIHFCHLGCHFPLARTVWVAYGWSFLCRPSTYRTINTGVYVGFAAVNALNDHLALCMGIPTRCHCLWSLVWLKFVLLYNCRFACGKLLQELLQIWQHR